MQMSNAPILATADFDKWNLLPDNGPPTFPDEAIENEKLDDTILEILDLLPPGLDWQAMHLLDVMSSDRTETPEHLKTLAAFMALFPVSIHNELSQMLARFHVRAHRHVATIIYNEGVLPYVV